MDAIHARDLNKTYFTKVKGEGLHGSLRALLKPETRSIAAVKNLSLTVAPGEIVAFIGPNGAGKSTTIKMCTGILHPTSGTVRVLGLDPVTQRKELARRVGTVFGQKSQLWLHLPPLDSFDMLGAIYDVDPKTLKKRIGELTERFELQDLLGQPVRKMSLGQRIRCEIAASLLHDPDIIFLDEPTIGLDVVVKHSIRELILDLNRERGTTIFLTSHDAGDVEQLCRRAVVIDHGELVLDRPVEDLKTHYLNKKVITIRLDSPRTLPSLPGVTALESESGQIRLSVDTRACPVGEVLSRITAMGGIADITVTDPPMEEIISEIFKSGGDHA